jgi:uncharacterized membrane-anchored protein YhcB (DUF1043 family)
LQSVTYWFSWDWKIKSRVEDEHKRLGQSTDDLLLSLNTQRSFSQWQYQEEEKDREHRREQKEHKSAVSN